MEQLIFFAVIIFFSILESVARTRRAKERRESGEAPPERFEWAQTPPWETEQLPTYDQDAPYDEEPSHDDRALATGRPPEPPKPAEPPSVADIWAEITGLATEALEKKKEARPRSIPRQSPPLPTPAPSRDTDVESPAWPPPTTPGPYDRQDAGLQALPEYRPSRTSSQHVVHRAHAGYGTDPSSRAPSAQDGLDPLAAQETATAKAVRAQLHLGREALRQAFVLQEVFGPPLSMRGDRGP